MLTNRNNMKYYYSLLTFLIVSTFSFSQTVNLNPVEDNSIYSDATSNSSGLGKLYAGETCAAGIRRALLKFDLSNKYLHSLKFRLKCVVSY